MTNPTKGTKKHKSYRAARRPTELALPAFGTPADGRQCAACGRWYHRRHYWRGDGPKAARAASGGRYLTRCPMCIDARRTALPAVELAALVDERAARADTERRRAAEAAEAAAERRRAAKLRRAAPTPPTPARSRSRRRGAGGDRRRLARDGVDLDALRTAALDAAQRARTERLARQADACPTRGAE